MRLKRRDNMIDFVLDNMMIDNPNALLNNVYRDHSYDEDKDVYKVVVEIRMRCYEVITIDNRWINDEDLVCELLDGLSNLGFKNRIGYGGRNISPVALQDRYRRGQKRG